MDKKWPILSYYDLFCHCFALEMQLFINSSKDVFFQAEKCQQASWHRDKCVVLWSKRAMHFSMNIYGLQMLNSPIFPTISIDYANERSISAENLYVLPYHSVCWRSFLSQVLFRAGISTLRFSPSNPTFLIDWL